MAQFQEAADYLHICIPQKDLMNVRQLTHKFGGYITDNAPIRKLKGVPVWEFKFEDRAMRVNFQLKWNKNYKMWVPDKEEVVNENIIKEDGEGMSSTASAGDIGFLTPKAFTGGKASKKMKKTAQQLGMELIPKVGATDTVDEDVNQSIILRRQFAQMFREGLSNPNDKGAKIVWKKSVTIKNAKEVFGTDKFNAFIESYGGTFGGVIDKQDGTTVWGDEYKTKEAAIKDLTNQLAAMERNVKYWLSESTQPQLKVEVPFEELPPRKKIYELTRQVKQQVEAIESTFDKMINIKNEENVSPDDYYKRTHQALRKINEKVVKMIHRMNAMK